MDDRPTGLVALVVYALHGYDGVLDRDLGVFSYGGMQVARGTPPYVGIFNSVGPLADAVPGLAMWLGDFVGADPILSARLFFTVLSALCCSLLCVLARDTLQSRTAGLIAPALFLTFEDFLRLASDGPREKTTMVLFMLGPPSAGLAAGTATAAATGLAQANSHLPDLSLIVQHAATLASDAAFGNSGLSFTPGGSLPDPAASQAVLVANLGHHST